MPKKIGISLLNVEYEADIKDRKSDDSINDASLLVPSTGGYEEYLSDQLSSARDDFNTAINWAITCFGVVLSLILTASSFPDLISWLLSLVLFILCTHFATRAIRGYINIIRWALILRRVTKFNLAQSKGIRGPELEHLKQAVYDAITIYHINWASPISRRQAVSKIIVEFGFCYYFVIILGLLLWIGTIILYRPEMLITGIICILVVIWEWQLLLHSVYLRNIHIADETPLLISGIQ